MKTRPRGGSVSASALWGVFSRYGPGITGGWRPFVPRRPGDPRRLQPLGDGLHKSAPALHLPVKIRGGLHPAVWGAVGPHNAQDLKAVPAVLLHLFRHQTGQGLPILPWAVLFHSAADAGVLLHHRAVRPMDVPPVQSQTAQLRAGHLDDAHLMVQRELDELPKGGGTDGGAVGDGVLVQQAVGQKNHFFASAVGEHQAFLLFERDSPPFFKPSHWGEGAPVRTLGRMRGQVLDWGRCTQGTLPMAARRRKVHSTPFPPGGENCVRSLAPPLPGKPAALGFAGSNEGLGKTPPGDGSG